MRPLRFENDRYYHIYNRGVDKRKIFLRYGHYSRFTHTIHTLLDTGSASEPSAKSQGLALKNKVEIMCYCLMPNHYHFVMHQLQDNGITEFMHHLNTSYTMFFNKNINRSGRLFEYTFKAKIIESDDMLLHISRYVHINPTIAGLVDDVSLYPWSSYLEYVGKRTETFCQTQTILSFFGNDPMRYKTFVHDQVAYARLLHQTEHEDKDGTPFL